MEDGYGGTPENPLDGFEDVQRWAALAGGGWLIARGLFKRSIVGIGMMFVGGILLDRGLTGRWSTERDPETARHGDGGAGRARRTEADTATGIKTSGAHQAETGGTHPETGQAQGTPARTGKRGVELAEATEEYDRVDETSADSFPASDSPSWTPDTRYGEPPHK